MLLASLEPEGLLSRSADDARRHVGRVGRRDVVVVDAVRVVGCRRDVAAAVVEVTRQSACVLRGVDRVAVFGKSDQRSRALRNGRAAHVRDAVGVKHAVGLLGSQVPVEVAARVDVAAASADSGDVAGPRIARSPAHDRRRIACDGHAIEREADERDLIDSVGRAQQRRNGRDQVGQRQVVVGRGLQAGGRDAAACARVGDAHVSVRIHDVVAVGLHRIPQIGFERLEAGVRRAVVEADAADLADRFGAVGAVLDRVGTERDLVALRLRAVGQDTVDERGRAGDVGSRQEGGVEDRIAVGVVATSPESHAGSTSTRAKSRRGRVCIGARVGWDSLSLGPRYPGPVQPLRPISHPMCTRPPRPKPAA